MKPTHALLAAALAVAVTPAFADFELLPTTDPLRVDGSANINNDPLFIPQGTDNGNGTFELPAHLQLLASLETEFELPDEDDPEEFEEVGTFYDAVFRDLNDNKLVFGSRIVMDPEEEGEINDVFRFGFAGYSAEAAWTFVTTQDLRLYSAARSLNSGIDDEDVFDPDVVGLATDVNVEEGNAMTGWYFVKTNATGFALFENAIGLNQAGEEDQAPYTAFISGYAPVPIPAAVWMFGAGLAGLAGFARRRR